MSSQRDGREDDASQTAPEEGEDNTGTQPAASSLLGSIDDLLTEARDSGHVIGDPVRTQPQDSETEDKEESEQGDVETDPGDTTDEEIEEEDEAKVAAESEPEESEEEEEEEPSGDLTKIEKEIKALEEKGEKVPWYLSRIAQDTRKKNEWKKAAEKTTNIALQWKAKAEEIEARLSELLKDGGPAPRIQTADPLANVFSLQDLQVKKNDAEKWVAWAERNRNGGDAVVGKDDKGDPVTKYLDEEAVTNLKLGCEKVLREGVPQRAAYLNNKAQFDNKAVEIYPEYKNRDSTFTREAFEILQALQAGFIPPDVMVWIGHAITARNEFLARSNGSGKAKGATGKIVASAKTRVAPKPIKSRGFVPRRSGADLDTARKDLQTKGDAESAEKLLERLNIGGGPRSKRVEVIEQ